MITLSLLTAAAVGERYRIHRRVRGLPGPRWPLPLLGAVPWVVRDPAAFYARQHTRYHQDANISWHYMFGSIAWFVSDVPTARKVFLEADTYQFLVEPWKPLLGDENIAFLNGPEHHTLRRRIMPLLQRAALDRYHPRLDACVRAHIDRLRAAQAKAPGQPVDIVDDTRRLAIQTISEVVCGDALPAGDLPSLIDDFEAMNRGFLAMPVPWLPGSTMNRAMKARERIHRKLVGYVATARARIAAGHTPDCVLEGWLTRIEDGDGFRATDEDIARTAIDLIFASQDGVFSVMLWVWVRLAEHPDVLQRIRQELHEQGATAGPIPAETLHRMEYLRWFVKEIFRFQSPAPVVPHRVARDAELAPGVRVREGDVVFPLMQAMQHAEYAGGDRFDPMRHAPGQKRDDQAYFAFGVGPHRCPGMEYTYTVLALYTAHAVLSFDWTRTRTARSDTLVPAPSLIPGDVLLSLRPASEARWN